MHNFWYSSYICDVASKWVNTCFIVCSELIFHVRTQALVFVSLLLKNNTAINMQQLVDITVIDYPDRMQRFEVVYNFLSVANNARIRLKVKTDYYSLLPSLNFIYKSSGWLEREIWDFFGIFFSSHPDLRRILTDYGFEGYPLRKDFPLSGYVEVRYDDEQKRVVYESIELSQEFRFFDFLSPWEQNFY